MRRLVAALLVGLCACSSAPRPAVAQERGAVAMGEAVAGLGQTARVLLIAAHPDDEDTRLVAWLARGRHVETAYLSLTRGDGGQNLIGNELGEALGVIRTEELLAARRIDGAHQYFTRAFDFGFSKSAAETYSHWPHDSVLGDVVTVVRAFKPHIIIAVFSGTPADGHGHHQVSGILAREAYDVSLDTVRFPTSKYGPAWTVSKFYRDKSYFGGGDNTLRIPVGQYDPLLGESYAEIAARSRSQHKSQGFGQIVRKGPFTAYVYREATRVAESTPAGQERTLFDGIDTTLARLGALTHDPRRRVAFDSAAVLIARIQANWNPAKPAAIAADVATVARLLRPHPSARDDPDVEQSVRTVLERADRAMLLATGIVVEANAERDVLAARRDSLTAKLSLYNRGPFPSNLVALRWSDGPSTSLDYQTDVLTTTSPDSVRRDSVTVVDTVVSQPWWLTKPRAGDLFGVPVSRIAEDQRTNGAVSAAVSILLPRDSVPTYGVVRRQPALPPPSVGVDVPVLHRISDPARGEIDRPLAGVPAISVTLDHTVDYVPARTRLDRVVHVLLRSALDGEHVVRVTMAAPRGLVADSATRDVVLSAFGSRRVDFRVTGTLPVGDALLAVTAVADGHTYANGYVPIEYDHIRPQKLYRDATVHLVAVDLHVPAGLTVAYIRGVGDNVAPTLEALGIPVTVLDPAALPTTDLSKFSTVVVGTRAYESSPDLGANNRRLLDYARTGGTVVVQYGQYEMAGDGIMPFPITLSRPADRVTDENSAVRVLDPKSPLLSFPNKIGDADWNGWVQERSLYMPHTFDSRYQPLLSLNDPGEAPNQAAILAAPLGKGVYVYTTMSFFRQLPAGVPGAARLFINLLSAGHSQVVQ